MSTWWQESRMKRLGLAKEKLVSGWKREFVQLSFLNDFLTVKVSLSSSFLGPFMTQSCLSTLKRISIWLPGDHIDPVFGRPKWLKDGAVCWGFRKLLLGSRNNHAGMGLSWGGGCEELFHFLSGHGVCSNLPCHFSVVKAALICDISVKEGFFCWLYWLDPII